MIRSTDRLIKTGLYLSPTYFYQAESSEKTSTMKQIFRNSDLFVAIFISKIIPFIKENIPNLPHFTTRLANIKKTGVTSEYFPNHQVVVLEPIADFRAMMKSYFMQLVFVDQKQSGQMVPLADNSYQWKTNGVLEEIKLPRNIFALADLPHISDAQKRAEILVNKFFSECLNEEKKIPIKKKLPNAKEMLQHM